MDENDDAKLVCENGVWIVLPASDLETRKTRPATDDEDGMLAGLEALIKTSEPQSAAELQQLGSLIDEAEDDFIKMQLQRRLARLESIANEAEESE